MLLMMKYFFLQKFLYAIFFDVIASIITRAGLQLHIFFSRGINRSSEELNFMAAKIINENPPKRIVHLRKLGVSHHGGCLGIN